MEGRTNEAVADLDKALAKGTSSSGSAYGSTGGEARRSYSEKQPRESEDAARLKTPGGFRRDFLIQQAETRGMAPEDVPLAWQQSLLETMRPLNRAELVESMLGIRLDPETGQEIAPATRRAGRMHTVVALIKSFIGSGITFTPSAFTSGGWLLSSILLVCIASVSFICVRMLLECRAQTKSSSYGEIAEMALGPRGRLMVHVSLVLSQYGVCIALMMFVSELAQTMGMKSWAGAILGQLPLLIPLCLIRSVRHLEIPNLVADLLIISGLAVVLQHHIHLLWSWGVDTTVVAYKPSTFGVSIGTLIYIFEGIPMILPIRNAMQEPGHFLPIFSWVFLGVSCFFLVFGLLGYLCLGETARTVVLLNLPPNSALTTATRSAYMLALMLGLPLMFLPAARITELWAFGVVRKGQLVGARAWLRVAQVFALAYIACRGGPYFDKILALIGAFCATPIAFIYPAMFHLKLCTTGGVWRALDVGCIGFGVVAAAATLFFL